MDDDRSSPLHKIQISGATLSAVLHRSSTSCGDLHGLLFGHLSLSTPTPLSDHNDGPHPPSTILTITSFISLPSHLPLPPLATDLLGFFSSRRKTKLHPSLKDSITLTSLSSSSIKTPLICLLITTPFHEKVIHTYEYKAFLCKDSSTFEAKSLHVVNIGPCFRSPYEGFSPHAGFPVMGYDDAMVVENDDDDATGCLLGDEGFSVERLGKLMGSEFGCTVEVEGLYGNMLAKMETLRKLVEESDDKLLEQEDQNTKLRYRVCGIEGDRNTNRDRGTKQVKARDMIVYERRTKKKVLVAGVRPESAMKKWRRLTTC